MKPPPENYVSHLSYVKDRKLDLNICSNHYEMITIARMMYRCTINHNLSNILLITWYKVIEYVGTLS